MSDKCDHKGQWRIAGPVAINNLPVELLVGATLFCRNCGKLKTKLDKMKVTAPPKSPVVKPVTPTGVPMRMPPGMPVIKKGALN